MGYSVQSVPFFTDDIIIVPHTATHEHHLSRPVSIREFSQGKPCALNRILETGEYECRLIDGTFIHGPEEAAP